jgi:hypothetical protein
VSMGTVTGQRYETDGRMRTYRLVDRRRPCAEGGTR